MKLYEYEGKQILLRRGIAVPEGFEFSVDQIEDAAIKTSYPAVLKAQILEGGRGKRGGIITVSGPDMFKRAAHTLCSSSIGIHRVETVRAEHKCDVVRECYISIAYHQERRMPVLTFSGKGGVDVETNHNRDIDVFRQVYIDPLKPFPREEIYTHVASFMGERDGHALTDIAEKLIAGFREEHLRLLEINPLAKCVDGSWVALDAKIMLDEDAYVLHPEWSAYSPRTLFGRMPNERERAVKQIDEGKFYYRGTASKYIDLEGDIAVMFSGGGASIACMDALITAGGRPANYTEYSGNPPREKVRALADIVLSKHGLSGLWIAGGFANFTRIDETFAGIVDIFEKIKPRFPIVVRRAGPFDNEGKTIMEEAAERLDLDLTYFDRATPMTATARIMAEKAARFRDMHK
ncbi:MAG: ATP-grasp domain-containing protein [Candidatus Sungbacteria bacterium]|nr:ATP citrate lyase citrate-binding domain-containing protein [bacterium]MDZ4285445.1 ATP-grasp domain-containing protein [Candidatus Sungbacteria bacterium]